MNKRAGLLTLLQALFLCRVVGQVLVETMAPAWLPDARHWESGLLPYPLLLLAQLVILLAMTAHTRAAWRTSGRWYVTERNTIESLRLLAGFYAAAMVLRYVLTMVFAPELRWFGHSIPIFFHLVLAAYVFALTCTPRHKLNPAYKSYRLS